MRAVGTLFGAASQDPPLPPRLRAYALAALALLVPLFAPPPAAAQATGGWAFHDDAFADLWFHGLAVVGLHGFGAHPLYDPGYALQVRDERAASGAAPTLLERERSRFLGAFQRDEAFEVLHFVPLYFAGSSREDALRALTAVAQAGATTPQGDGATHLGVQVVAGLLSTPAQRQSLGAFVRALEEEWSAVVQPRRARAAGTGAPAARLQTEWARSWAGPLAGFLQAEGLARGTVIRVPALGAEGRFLERAPDTRLPLVAVGDAGGDPAASLSSLLRELCYPAVRRAFAPFESRFDDRVGASRASDLSATRCGELLLERHAPQQLAAYRARFGIPTGGMGPGFLSASGAVPGASAWEGQLERALLRELNLDADGVRAAAPPVGRH